MDKARERLDYFAVSSMQSNGRRLSSKFVLQRTSIAVRDRPDAFVSPTSQSENDSTASSSVIHTFILVDKWTSSQYTRSTETIESTAASCRRYTDETNAQILKINFSLDYVFSLLLTWL